jgi:hypothetical protein
MKEYIEAHRIEVKENEDSLISKIEVGSKLKELDKKGCTEAEALLAVKAEVPIDAKSKPIPVKYYKHVCDHDQNNRTGCRLVEIKELEK